MRLTERTKGEDGVETPEGKGVGEGEFRGGIAGGAGDDVEIERGVDFDNTGVGGQESFFETEDRGESFDGSGGSDGVAVERLGRTDGDL